MTIKETPTYRFKFMDANEPFKNLPAVTQQVAERLEQAMTDAQIPPGNPDLNAVLDRLNKLEDKTKTRKAKFTCSVTPAAGTITNQGVLQPTADDDNANNDFCAPGPAGVLTFTRDGEYLITYLDYSASNPGVKQCFIRPNAGGTAYASDDSGAAWESNALAVVTATAGEQVKFNVQPTNSARCDAIIKVKKLA